MSETPRDPDDIDLGIPIPQLKDLDLEPGSDFVHGFRRKINRRSLANHSVDLGVGGLTVFVKEYVAIVMESVRGSRLK